MKSILAKILLWTLAIFVTSLTAFAAASIYLAHRSPGPFDFLNRTFALMETEAIRSFEEGGPKGLADYLIRLDRCYPARHFLTNPAGRDLVSGEDRSRLMVGASPPARPRRAPEGGMVIVRQAGGGRYRFLILLATDLDPPLLLPYFGAIVLVAIALLGYALAVHFAAPLRDLRIVVNRFGGGDLDARVRSNRKDEIGELSRSFDEMAGQIQTLRAAELRLLQDVSHELRSPLARLGFNVELARSVDDPEAHFGRIEKDLDRLSSLVAEILQLTCAEGDPTSRTQAVVRLDDLLRSLAEDCSAEAIVKGCWLDLRIDAEASLIGDPELLRRGIENVVRNAIRHAPDGTSIEIDSQVLDDGATITIRDHGPGVPESALAAIFEPFFRVGDDRSRSGGGVGLGLSIARRALELHQGRVIARNADPGLQVFIDLPILLAN